MNKFLFRVWDLDIGRMYYPENICFAGDSVILDGIEKIALLRNEFVVMQFIGFDDIYEGDIVKGFLTLENDDNYDFVGHIIYKAPSFVCDNADFPLECYDKFEVIGNVYENNEV